MTLLVQKMQIERVIRRNENMAEAEFYSVTPNGNWLCCTACISARAPFDSVIQGRTNSCMTPAQAHILMTALQMAITWITEEQTRLTPPTSSDPAAV